MVLTGRKFKSRLFFPSLKAFTLLEILTVVIIVVIMSAFAIPNYMKVMRKNHERNMMVNLMTIHGANEIYRIKSGGNDEYLPGAGLDLNGINAGLSLKMVDDNAVYSYTRATTTTYQVTADLGGVFELKITQDPVSDSNPCCFAGICQLRPGC